MFIEIKMPMWIIAIFCLEIAIYLWSYYSSVQKENSYLAIPQKLIFEKCARNSGRISAIINLLILLMIGYFGIKQIYENKENLNLFINLNILFTTNHLIHFLYIVQNFKKKSRKINLAQEKHGIVTFICISIFPVMIYNFKHLNTLLYIGIIFHLLNVSYVFIDVLYNKIRVKAPVTIHNKCGIVAIILAWIVILYSIFLEY